MTAAARTQRLSEGSPCNIGSTAAKLCRVQASLGPVQEDRPQGGVLLGGGFAAWQPAARWQLLTEVHDYKQSLIQYGVRTGGVSESILEHPQETVFS